MPAAGERSSAGDASLDLCDLRLFRKVCDRTRYLPGSAWLAEHADCSSALPRLSPRWSDGVLMPLKQGRGFVQAETLKCD